MKYLDERIIANVTLKSPSLEDRLYRYDVAIDDEWDNPIFIGNCFIGTNIPTKSIDITDIVRNYYDFSYPYRDTEFQAEWQVRIWLDKDELEHSYSDKIGIYPIYRYPNRKARMETPLSNNGLKWYMPALQGFNSDKKGEFLPHIPFVYSDKVDYNLAVNIGNLSDANPYLYTGVKKELKTADFGIYNTQYKLSELWKGKTKIPTVNYDSTWMSYNDEADSKYIYFVYSLDLTGGTITFKRFPYFINRIRLTAFFKNEEDQEISVNYAGDIGSRTYTYSYTSQENTYDNANADYVDFYMDYGDTTFLNIYPSFVTPFITGSYSINLKLSETTGENHPEWITIPKGGSTFGGGIIQLPTFTEKVFNIFLRDANDNNIQNLGNCSENKPVKVQINPTTEAAKIVYTDVVNNNVFLTMEIPNSEVLTKNTAIFYATANGIVQFTNAYWSGTYTVTMNANYEYENVNDTIDVVDKVDKRFYGYASVTPTKGDLIFDKSDNYDSIIDNGVTLWFDKGSVDENEYAGDEDAVIMVKNKVTDEIVFKYGFKYFVSVEHQFLWTDKPQKPEETEIIFYVYNTQISDYYAKVVIDLDKKIGDYICGIELAKNDDTNEFKVIALKKTYATPADKTFTVATIDYCPSRYYLQWRDRYGSMQMQPFSKAETYSEDFTRTEIKNYQDTRRLSGISVQPKWKLNSAWIPFDLVPYYESLQVSPWVKLYDTKEDKLYDVILKDTAFTEKTFRNNDRQLWHMEIECEQTDKQNILY